MTEFNVYTDNRGFDVVVGARSMKDALDIAARRRGLYVDHADMCGYLGLVESDLNIVAL